MNFSKELSKNNNREWFQHNKPWYLDVKTKHEKWVSELIAEIAKFDADIQLLTPRDCVFRIYRDVRFSKSKNPYKTSFGSVFCKGGRKSKFAGYYLHIEPGKSFVGGGIWRPSPEVLKSIRYEIYNSPTTFLNIIKSEEFFRRFGEISGEKLTRPPKDFPKDFEHVDLLKFKSFTVGQSLPDEQVLKANFMSIVTGSFNLINPFVKFLNHGIENI